MKSPGFIDPPESCGIFCTHHGKGSCSPCVFQWYPLSPELAAEKKAAYVGVCDECAATTYSAVLPADAKMKGEPERAS